MFPILLQNSDFGLGSVRQDGFDAHAAVDTGSPRVKTRYSRRLSLGNRRPCLTQQQLRASPAAFTLRAGPGLQRSDAGQPTGSHGSAGHRPTSDPARPPLGLGLGLREPARPAPSREATDGQVPPGRDAAALRGEANYARVRVDGDGLDRQPRPVNSQRGVKPAFDPPTERRISSPLGPQRRPGGEGERAPRAGRRGSGAGFSRAPPAEPGSCLPGATCRDRTRPRPALASLARSLPTSRLPRAPALE